MVRALLVACAVSKCQGCWFDEDAGLVPAFSFGACRVLKRPVFFTPAPVPKGRAHDNTWHNNATAPEHPGQAPFKQKSGVIVS